MNPDKLLDAIGMLDDRYFEAEKKSRIIPWRRRLVALIAAVLMVILSVGTAMAVSPEFRELVFRFFHISGVQTIPESTVGSDISVDDMFVEPTIRIGDVLQGKYIHTPVSTLAEDGVFLVCTDDVHTKQGSHYDAYYEKQGAFIKLEEQSFNQEYALYGETFHIQCDWAEYNGKTIITWVDENANFRIPGNTGDPSALLIQLVFASTNDNGEYIESYYPVLLNLRTGELSDVLAGTGAERLEWIGNSAISEDLTKMLLCNTTKDGYTLYYVDLTSKQMYSLDDLSGEKVDSCSLIGNTLACWSLTDGYYKAWNIDLATLQRTELFDSIFNAASTQEADAGIVFMMGFDSWVHEGNMYAGSAFALEVDEAQNVFVIDLATGQKAPIAGYTWTADTQRIPDPDGTKLLLAECPDWQDYEYVGVLDFENLTFTEFSRENRQNEYLAYWFDENTVVICGELTPESLCSDYYLYEIIPETELAKNNASVISESTVSVDENLAVLIDGEIISHYQSKDSKNNFCCLDWEVIGIEKSDNLTTVYMWALCREYSNNSILTVEASSHSFVAITAKEDDGYYSLVEYWIPEDGDYYSDSLKEKVPMYLWNQAMDSQRYIDKQSEELDELARKYFGITNTSVFNECAISVVDLISGKEKDITDIGDVRVIQELISSELWKKEEGSSACDNDFKITINGESYWYHSDCGTIVDFNNNRYITLSDEQMNEINRIFTK